MKIDTIIEKGKFIRKCKNPKELAFFKENEDLVAKLYENYRFEWVLGRDGSPLNMANKDWVVHGSKGQVYEFGILKLGFTIEGSKRIEAFKRQNSSWSTVHQNGDSECNFKCDWNDKNVESLFNELKLVRRRRLQY